MWPFDKKYLLEQMTAGWTDWHCHVLPGVDDGIPELEDSLKVLEYYESCGVKQVWLTPHIMQDVPNETSALKERFAELREAYSGPVALHLASENMLDSLFKERLAARDLLPLGEGHLLVETSYFSPPMDLWELLENIKSAGFWPVLAHPERYVYMGPGDYSRLVGMGVELQLNLPSLAGSYGKEAQAKALWILKKGWYGRSGSDLHRLHVTREALQKPISLGGPAKEALGKVLQHGNSIGPYSGV